MGERQNLCQTRRCRNGAALGPAYNLRTNTAIPCLHRHSNRSSLLFHTPCVGQCRGWKPCPRQRVLQVCELLRWQLNPDTHWMSNERLRRAIVVEAARLMYSRNQTEYYRAKLKAAKRLCKGWVKPSELPTNAEIRDEIQRMANLFEGSSRFDRLREMRVEALRVMRLLGKPAGGKPAGTQNVRIERHEECRVPVDGHAERVAREFSAAARAARYFPVPR